MNPAPPPPTYMSATELYHKIATIEHTNDWVALTDFCRHANKDTDFVLKLIQAAGGSHILAGKVINLMDHPQSNKGLVISTLAGVLLHSAGHGQDKRISGRLDASCRDRLISLLMEVLRQGAQAQPTPNALLLFSLLTDKTDAFCLGMMNEHSCEVWKILTSVLTDGTEAGKARAAQTIASILPKIPSRFHPTASEQVSSDIWVRLTELVLATEMSERTKQMGHLALFHLGKMCPASFFAMSEAQQVVVGKMLVQTMIHGGSAPTPTTIVNNSAPSNSAASVSNNSNNNANLLKRHAITTLGHLIQHTSAFAMLLENADGPMLRDAFAGCLLSDDEGVRDGMTSILSFFIIHAPQIASSLNAAHGVRLRNLFVRIVSSPTTTTTSTGPVVSSESCQRANVGNQSRDQGKGSSSVGSSISSSSGNAGGGGGGGLGVHSIRDAAVCIGRLSRYCPAFAISMDFEYGEDLRKSLIALLQGDIDGLQPAKCAAAVAIGGLSDQAPLFVYSLVAQFGKTLRDSLVDLLTSDSHPLSPVATQVALGNLCHHSSAFTRLLEKDCGMAVIIQRLPKILEDVCLYRLELAVRSTLYLCDRSATFVQGVGESRVLMDKLRQLSEGEGESVAKRCARQVLEMVSEASLDLANTTGKREADDVIFADSPRKLARTS